MGDLSVPGREDHDIRQNERACRRAGPCHFLLYHDDVRVGGAVDRDCPVALVAQRAGVPERGDEAHDRISAFSPGQDARPGEGELVNRVGGVHAGHVVGGPGDGSGAHALQDVERAGQGWGCHRVASVTK
jgi:hypothetical protein